MIKTNNFVKTLSDKGLVDDAVFIENGYDIQYKGNIISVRLNNKGGALIFNHKRNNMVEIQSGRLDDVLHRYIFQSVFGIHSGIGVRGNTFENVAFVPTKVIKNAMIFEDAEGRKFTVKGTSPQAILSYFKQTVETNCDDIMVLLDGFQAYEPGYTAIESSVESPEVEVQLLKCSTNFDDYAVSARPDAINDIGKTVVGNMLCSSADKVNLMTFEADTSKAFAYNVVARKNINSNTIRTKNPFAIKTKKVLSSNAQRNIVSDYVDQKYSYGLSIDAMEQVLAYEAPALFSAAKVDNPIDYKALFNRYLSKADSVQFRLDSNKSILCAVSNENSVAKFRATPLIASMHDSLQSEGYLLSELENGLEFNIKDTAVAAIVSNCKEFAPVAEKPLNMVNTVNKVIGSACTKVLSEYGIDDSKGVFTSLMTIAVN